MNQTGSMMLALGIMLILPVAAAAVAVWPAMRGWRARRHESNARQEAMLRHPSHQLNSTPVTVVRDIVGLGLDQQLDAMVLDHVPVWARPGQRVYYRGRWSPTGDYATVMGVHGLDLLIRTTGGVEDLIPVARVTRFLEPTPKRTPPTI